MSIREKSYDILLKNDMQRRERNVRLLTKLENIEKKAAFLQAKTDRIRSLKSIYKNHFSKTPVVSYNSYAKNDNEYTFPGRYITNQYNDNFRNNLNISENIRENRNSPYIMKNITLDEAIEEIARRYILIPKTPLTKTITEEKYPIDTNKNINSIKDNPSENRLNIPDILSDESNEVLTPSSNDNDCDLNNENKDDVSEKHIDVDVVEIPETISHDYADPVEEAIPETYNRDDVKIEDPPEDPRLQLLTTEVAYNEEIGAESSKFNPTEDYVVQNDNIEPIINASEPSEDIYVEKQTDEVYYDGNQAYKNENVVVESNPEYDQNYTDYIPQEDAQANFNEIPQEEQPNYDEQYYANQDGNAEIQNTYSEEQGYAQNDNAYGDNQTNQYDGENINNVYDYQTNPETTYEQDYDPNQQNNFVEQNYNDGTLNENQDTNYDQYQENTDKHGETYNPDTADDSANVYNAENSQEYQQEQINPDQYNAENYQEYQQEQINPDQYNAENYQEYQQEQINPDQYNAENSQEYQQDQINPDQYNAENSQEYQQEQINPDQYSADNSQYNYYEQEGDSQYYNENESNKDNIEISEENNPQPKPLQILDSDTDPISNKDETSVQESDFDFSTQQ